MKYILLIALLATSISAELIHVDFTDRDTAEMTEINHSIKEGDLLQVTLKENPTTGYVWRYENPFEKASEVYTIEMDEYTERTNSELKNGVTGIRTIVLKAEKAGTDVFELVLVRSWEVQDFIEARAANGEPVKMNEVPNVEYHLIRINV